MCGESDNTEKYAKLKEEFYEFSDIQIKISKLKLIHDQNFSIEDRFALDLSRYLMREYTPLRKVVTQLLIANYSIIKNATIKTSILEILVNRLRFEKNNEIRLLTYIFISELPLKQMITQLPIIYRIYNNDWNDPTDIATAALVLLRVGNNLTIENIRKRLKANPSLREILTEYSQYIPSEYAIKILAEMEDNSTIKNSALKKTWKKIDKNKIQSKSTMIHYCNKCGLPLMENAQDCLACDEKILFCIICNVRLKANDSVGQCPICQVKGHLPHLQKWIQTHGICPQCLRPVSLDEIIIL